MSFETISLLLNWMEMGALLAILFRLSNSFDLIANTQRELRRAVHRLGDRRTVAMAVLAFAVSFICGSDLDGLGPFLASFLIGGHCSRISSATVGGSGRNPPGHSPSPTCFARSRQ